MGRRFQSVSLLLAGTLIACSAAAAAPAAGDGSRQVGPFEISARVRSSGDSARFLRSGNPFGNRSVREYEVRWNGRSIELPVIGKRFWQALHLPDAPQPALLVVNGPRLHLVVDSGGRLDVRALAPDSGNFAVQWLDNTDGQPAAPVAGLGLDRTDDAPRTTLSGGRWLYLNNRLLLDLRTLATVAVEPWLDQGQGETVVSMNASNSPAIALSPGRTRFVLRGQGQDFGRGGERFDLLMLIDLATGKPEALRLDPGRTPYANLGAIDAAWIATHLQWTRGPDGRERLQPR
jgi:hypothetical protein